MKKFWIAPVFVLLAEISFAHAQIGETPREISVFASACENLAEGESKASARVRATDKASFKAVEEIPELSRFRSNMNTHNFNIKVYQLVDNYLEDLKINADSPSDGSVCVELSAYLPAAAIAEVFSAEQEDIKDKALSLELESTTNEENVLGITIPPKPNIVINEQIAYENKAEPAREIGEKKAFVVTQPKDSVSSKEDDVRVFVDRTTFYNGASTGGFFSQIEQALLGIPGVKAIAVNDDADYVLRTKVLKARVDSINSETSRLQIVVALELTDTASSKTITEHQNRFVLFDAKDDAQTVAADLTRKLLSTGLEKLLPEIKTEYDGPIITPNHSYFRPTPDAV